MTAPRRPRSAWLLVGSTPGTLAKVHSAGQRFSRFLAKVRWRRLRALFPAASSSSARSSALSGSMRSPRRAVSVPAALLPGGEQSPRDLQARGAELLLGTESLAVGGEVAHQVRPAELASLGVEVVVGPPAVRAGDAGELLAEQRLGLAAVATLGDPEDRGAEGERPPKRALAAAQAPAGLIHVDDRGAADLLCKVSVGLCERLAACCTMASIEPLESVAPNSSRRSSVVSRLETRLRTASVATAAWRRGPKAPGGTPAGSFARVSAAQAGQRSRCRRCSLTHTAIAGSSQT